jgi:hypothetical protein
MNMLRKSVSGSRLVLLTLLLLTLVSTFTLLTPRMAQAAVITCSNPDSYPGTITTCYDANHKLICRDDCGEDDCDCTGAKYYTTIHTCCFI